MDSNEDGWWVTVGAEEQIQGIVRAINQAWLRRRPEELARWLHDQIVIAPPGFRDHVRGRQAAVASYEQFAAAATVHAATFDEAEVHGWGDVAVATCRFALDYEMGGERGHDTGWEVLVFRRAADAWQVVWRTIVPADSTGSPAGKGLPPASVPC